MGKEGIKEITDVIIAVDAGADLYVELKDGISWADLPKIMKYGSKLTEAIKDAKNIPAELADLDQAELVEIGTAAYHAVKKWWDVLKPSP